MRKVTLRKKDTLEEMKHVLPGINKDEGVYSDVLGSYTGTPVDGGVPVQDADDL